jgi:hypothetical protein
MTDAVIWIEGTVMASPSREWQGTTYGSVTFITIDNEGNPQTMRISLPSDVPASKFKKGERWRVPASHPTYSKKNNAMYWDLSNSPEARREMKQVSPAPKPA